MTFDTFIKAVDKLVYEWADSGREEREPPPTTALKAIYDEVREQAVYDVAQAIGPRLHKRYLEEAIPLRSSLRPE